MMNMRAIAAVCLLAISLGGCAADSPIGNALQAATGISPHGSGTVLGEPYAYNFEPKPAMAPEPPDSCLGRYVNSTYQPHPWQTCSDLRPPKSAPYRAKK